jgi:hypothetical protein
MNFPYASGLRLPAQLAFGEEPITVSRGLRSDDATPHTTSLSTGCKEDRIRCDSRP